MLAAKAPLIRIGRSTIIVFGAMRKQRNDSDYFGTMITRGIVASYINRAENLKAAVMHCISENKSDLLNSN